MLELFAQEISIYAKSACQINHPVAANKACFIPGSKFRGALLATQSHGIPPILDGGKRRQFVCRSFATLDLLQEPSPFVVGEVLVFIALQRQVLHHDSSIVEFLRTSYLRLPSRQHRSGTTLRRDPNHDR